MSTVPTIIIIIIIIIMIMIMIIIIIIIIIASVCHVDTGTTPEQEMLYTNAGTTT